VVIRIGTCGWRYGHWQPEPYAPGLPAADRLVRYAAAFPTAELNRSFYRWPRPAAFRTWRHKLPQGFRLPVKLAAAMPEIAASVEPGWEALLAKLDKVLAAED
jgi:uncharacterized protein YecE (DUF72 family)